MLCYLIFTERIMKRFIVIELFDAMSFIWKSDEKTKWSHFLRPL